MNPSQPHVTVFKGGTAFNSLLREFQEAFPAASYVVPVTDDGGSSKEIVRVFGGPSIGDLRSTLTRLSDESTTEGRAVKKLLEYRLSPQVKEQATYEWHMLLEDDHPLYEGISSKYRKLIRCFLCKFETERLQRISCQFDLRNGSIGNFFLSGARQTLGSLETAIFMYSSVARIFPTTHVLPIVDVNDRLGIAAKLKDSSLILGQHTISHPQVKGVVEKESFSSLPAPITELFYLDKFQNQINPKPHPEVIHSILKSHAVVYGMGSFWTSIVPSLILHGIGESIALLDLPKIALLNCCHDRETEHMSALDYIHNLTKSLNRYGALQHLPSAYITHLFTVEGTSFEADERGLAKLGIRLCKIKPAAKTKLTCNRKSYPVYDAKCLIRALRDLIDN